MINTTETNMEMPKGIIGKLERFYNVYAYYWRKSKLLFLYEVAILLLYLAAMLGLVLLILVIWVLFPPSIPITLVLWFNSWMG